MNMDRNTVSRSHDRGVYAATALASAKDETTRGVSHRDALAGSRRPAIGEFQGYGLAPVGPL
jgi:hypothetical protein